MSSWENFKKGSTVFDLSHLDQIKFQYVRAGNPETQTPYKSLTFVISFSHHCFTGHDGEEDSIYPHPSQEAIAIRMSVSIRTVQRGLYELENKGLLTKIKTSKDHPKYHGRNIYDLTQLVESLNHLTPHLKEKLNEE